MLQRSTLTPVVCLLALLPTYALSQSDLLREDKQVWSEFQAYHSIREKIDLLLIGTFRLGREARRPVYERGGVGLSFKCGRYVALSPLYGYFATQPLPGQDQREHRISLEGSVTLPHGRWMITDRNTFDRRFRDPRDSTRYHNKLQLERAVHVADVPFRVFVADEVLYDWSLNGWVRNRYSIGAGKNLSERLSLDLYYLGQNATRTVPRDLHVIGLMLRTDF